MNLLWQHVQPLMIVLSRSFDSWDCSSNCFFHSMYSWISQSSELIRLSNSLRWDWIVAFGLSFAMPLDRIGASLSCDSNCLQRILTTIYSLRYAQALSTLNSCVFLSWHQTISLCSVLESPSPSLVWIFLYIQMLSSSTVAGTCWECFLHLASQTAALSWTGQSIHQKPSCSTSG